MALPQPAGRPGGACDPGQRNLVTEQEVAMLYYESAPAHRRSLPWKRRDGNKKCCSGTLSRGTLYKRLPCLTWVPAYNLRENLAPDALAGLTVGIMLIPQGISYGLLADMPAQYGLYACLAAPLIYSLTGTCTQLQIGPFALISLLITSTVRPIIDPDEDQAGYVEAVLTLSIMIGILLTGMGMLRLGSLVNFLAKPVISGLTTGGALLILTSQLSSFLGMTIPRGQFFETWANVFKHIKEMNLASFAIGVISLTILTVYRQAKTTELGKRMRLSKQPMALYVMIAATLITKYANLHEDDGVRILGHVPGGIPAPHAPGAWNRVGDLIVPAFVISIVGYALSMATAKTFATKCNYEVSSNQELFALGLANLVGGFFNGYPAFSSLSRTCIVYECGAKTPLHNAFSALIIVFVLTLLTEYLYHLPYPCLAAIIFDSLKSLLDQWHDPVSLWSTHKLDCLTWVVTFLSVLAFDVAVGLGIGVGFSIVVLLYTVSNPSYAVIGRFPKIPWLFKDLNRYTEAHHVPGCLLFRFDSALHFANGENFRKNLLKAVADRYDECFEVGEVLHSVVVDASSMTSCDASALAALAKTQKELSSQGIELIMCNCRGNFRDILKRSKVSLQEYVTIQDAVAYAENKLPMEGEGSTRRPRISSGGDRSRQDGNDATTGGVEVTIDSSTPSSAAASNTTTTSAPASNLTWESDPSLASRLRCDSSTQTDEEVNLV